MSKKAIAYSSILVGSLLLPFSALAQPPGTLSIPLTAVVEGIAVVILNILWIVAVAFSIVMFVIAGMKFMTAQGNIEKVKEARNAVIWGVVGVFVILLAWSIIAVIRIEIGV